MSSFCLGCGTGLAEGERFCGNCGRDAASGASVIPALDPAIAFGMAPDTSGKAIFSMVSGVFSFFPPFAIVAIIFGHLSLSEIRRSAGRLVGKGLAITGLILGYGGLALIAALLIIGFASMARAGKTAAKTRVKGVTTVVPSKQPPAVSALRTLNTAEIAYAQAHPEAGYTCSLAGLSSAWGISSDLEQVKKNGFVVALQGCVAAKPKGPVTKYQVVVYPAAGTARLPAYCSNQSDDIKVDWSGSVQGCLTSGADLFASGSHP